METGDWRVETGGLVPKGLGGDSAEWKERGVKIEIMDWRLEISRIEKKNLWCHHSARSSNNRPDKTNANITPNDTFG